MHNVSNVKDLGIFVDDRLTFNCHMNNIVARASVTANIIMAVLLSRCGHYISVLLLSSFFSSPNLSGRRLQVYHTSTHGVALVRI